jgi:hypothetical protein
LSVLARPFLHRPLQILGEEAGASVAQRIQSVDISVTPIFANPFREAEFRYQRKSSNIIIEPPKLLVSRLDTQFLAPEQAMAEREIQMLIDQRVSGDALGQGDLAARGHW